MLTLRLSLFDSDERNCVTTEAEPLSLDVKTEKAFW
jgi:hypothetical protein